MLGDLPEQMDSDRECLGKPTVARVVLGSVIGLQLLPSIILALEIIY